MTLLIHYVIMNLSSILQTSLCLIGTILVVVPIYHIIVKLSGSSISKSTRSHLRKSLYIDETSQLPFAAMVNTIGRSALSSVDIVTTKLNLKPIDTQVCLLPKVSSDMVSGLTNTGNSCFLNSVLQALSSLPQLQHYLDQSSKISPSKKNLPVTRSLLKTLRLLSTPIYTIFKPIDIVNALKHRKQVINRQQQDAQELYQLLVSQLDDEIEKAKKRQGKENDETIENPLNGLLAYNITCTECGYSSGVQSHKFNNIQLNLPDNDAATTTLDQCLAEFTNLEYLEEVECVKCSLKNTITVLNNENPTNEKSKRTVQELEQQLKKENIEEGLDKLKDRILKSNGVKSKQALFVKPPPILCLHFVRSLFLPTGDMVKNTCQVEFPPILDLSPYCTQLPTTSPAKYRLMSTVVHYGDHYSGHYIAYKRKISAEKCNCNQCGGQGEDMLLKMHENEWFKISDDRVIPCETSDALKENPFMLLYELIQDEQPSLIEEEEEEEEENIEELLYSNIPAAPPSSPVLAPKLFKRKNLTHTIPSIHNHRSIPILTQ